MYRWMYVYLFIYIGREEYKEGDNLHHSAEDKVGRHRASEPRLYDIDVFFERHASSQYLH